MNAEAKEICGFLIIPAAITQLRGRALVEKTLRHAPRMLLIAFCAAIGTGRVGRETVRGRVSTFGDFFDSAQLTRPENFEARLQFRFARFI
jgi:hypothetical protein